MTKIAYLTTGLFAGAILASFAFALSPRPTTQDAAKLAPQMYKVLIDNAHVRVMDYRIAPGGKEPMHSHPHGVVVYYFTNADMRTTSPDGKVVTGHSRAGDVIWRDPVTHSAQNIGPNEVHSLLVEPKDSCK